MFGYGHGINVKDMLAQKIIFKATTFNWGLNEYWDLRLSVEPNFIKIS